MACHAVGDQRHGHAEPLQLPGGQTSTLQKWSCLVDVDVHAAAGLVRRAYHAKRRAVVDRGQGASVAVGEDVCAARHQVETESAHAPVGVDVLVGQLMSAQHQR